MIVMFCSVAIDPSIDIRALDVPVNAVATAFKQFLIDLSESLVPSCLQEELVEAASESKIIYALSCTSSSSLHVKSTINGSLLLNLQGHKKRID